jgi:hypothetical protein
MMASSGRMFLTWLVVLVSESPHFRRAINGVEFNIEEFKHMLFHITR